MPTCQTCAGLGQLKAQAGVAGLLFVQSVLHLLEAHRGYLVGPRFVRHHVHHCRQGNHHQCRCGCRIVRCSLHMTVQSACVPTFAAERAFQSSLSSRLKLKHMHQHPAPNAQLLLGCLHPRQQGPLLTATAL